MYRDSRYRKPELYLVLNSDSLLQPRESTSSEYGAFNDYRLQISSRLQFNNSMAFFYFWKTTSNLCIERKMIYLFIDNVLFTIFVVSGIIYGKKFYVKFIISNLYWKQKKVSEMLPIQNIREYIMNCLLLELNTGIKEEFYIYSRK